MSLSKPPLTSSRPSPPIVMSLPDPPRTRSLWLPPSRMSFPFPPTTRSFSVVASQQVVSVVSEQLIRARRNRTTCRCHLGHAIGRCHCRLEGSRRRLPRRGHRFRNRQAVCRSLRCLSVGHWRFRRVACRCPYRHAGCRDHVPHPCKTAACCAGRLGRSGHGLANRTSRGW